MTTQNSQAGTMRLVFEDSTVENIYIIIETEHLIPYPGPQVPPVLASTVEFTTECTHGRVYIYPVCPTKRLRPKACIPLCFDSIGQG